MTFGPRTPISPVTPAGQRLAGLRVEDGDLEPLEGPAAATELFGRKVEVQPVTAVGAERFGHPEQIGPRARPRAQLSGQDRPEAARPKTR